MILTKAATALKSLKTVEYSVQGEVFGSRVKATVRQKRVGVTSSGLMEGVYFVSGEVDKGSDGRERFVYSYDGTSLRVSIGTGTTVEVIDSPTAADIGRLLPFEAGSVGMPYIGSFIEQGATGWTAKRLDKQKVGAKECEVLELTKDVQGPDGGSAAVGAKWTFDPDTHLPVQFTSQMGNKTVTAIKLNPEFDDSLLKLEGTEVKLDTSAVFAKGLLETGTLAPEFRLKNSEGAVRTLSSYKGKLVILDFWGTWCLPCRKAMPALQELHTKYKDKGLAVVGVAVGDGEGNPVGFMKSNGYSYELLPFGDDMAKKYQAVALPTIYLLDKDGKILFGQAGYREDLKKELAAIIEKHLK